MGGNNHNNRAPDDPFAKIKFTIPSFSGYYNADAYLDWEMEVEQKLNAHLVPEQHRVRQVSSMFKEFAIVWWNGLAATNACPNTWEGLKTAMRDCFVPPSYHRDLRKKLQRLDQGSNCVQDYYAELQCGIQRCGIVEDEEDQLVRFYGGLHRDIQDIVDYKTYNTVTELFHCAILAEKELQGRSSTMTKPRSSTSSTFASNKRSFDPPSTVPK